MFDIKNILKHEIKFPPTEPILRSEVNGDEHIFFYGLIKIKTVTGRFIIDD
jgi:hypothetical protein